MKCKYFVHSSTRSSKDYKVKYRIRLVNRYSPSETVYIIIDIVKLHLQKHGSSRTLQFVTIFAG